MSGYPEDMGCLDRGTRTLSELKQDHLPMSRLPDYTVRESQRAKNITIRVTTAGEIVVVVPTGFDHAQIPSLLLRKRRWLDRSLSGIREQQRLFSEDQASALPAQINLRAIGERWTVHRYSSTTEKARAHEDPEKQLMLCGDLTDRTALRQALRVWVKDKARQHLVPWLADAAALHAFSVSKVAVRCQKTRWGSYSRRGTLSLNAQLLFLPSDLVWYVFLHELCHTRHLDHSKEFWSLLATHVSEAEELRRKLRGAWKYVPRWMTDTGVLS